MEARRPVRTTATIVKEMTESLISTFLEMGGHLPKEEILEGK